MTKQIFVFSTIHGMFISSSNYLNSRKKDYGNFYLIHKNILSYVCVYLSTYFITLIKKYIISILYFFRIGRKNALVLTGLAGGIIGLARSFTTWYWVYIFLEFLESAIGDSCSPVYILSKYYAINIKWKLGLRLEATSSSRTLFKKFKPCMSSWII